MHLTNTDPKGHDSPSPPRQEAAGAPEEIEITREMIDAGEARLNELFDAAIDPGSDVGLMCTPWGWAEAVYRAMQNKRGRRPSA